MIQQNNPSSVKNGFGNTWDEKYFGFWIEW